MPFIWCRRTPLRGRVREETGAVGSLACLENAHQDPAIVESARRLAAETMPAW